MNMIQKENIKIKNYTTFKTFGFEFDLFVKTNSILCSTFWPAKYINFEQISLNILRYFCPKRDTKISNLLVY